MISNLSRSTDDREWWGKGYIQVPGQEHYDRKTDNEFVKHLSAILYYKQKRAMMVLDRSPDFL